MNMINPFLDRIMRKRRAYRAIFLDESGNLTPDGEIVMRDLAKFSGFSRPATRLNKITGTIDPLAYPVMDGRREMFIRQFITMLRVDDDAIIKLSTPSQED